MLPVSIARGRFSQLVHEQLGKPVLWAAQGPVAFDCSGLVMWALLGVGASLVDHNAQMLADETPNLATAPGAKPLQGDLCFYGESVDRISHVAVWWAGGRCISADGATSRVRELKTALASKTARVRMHDKASFRKDLPYFAVHRNRFLDDLDLVSR